MSSYYYTPPGSTEGGPWSADDILSWIADGTIQPETPIRRDDQPAKPAQEFAQFGAAFQWHHSAPSVTFNEALSRSETRATVEEYNHWRWRQYGWLAFWIFALYQCLRVLLHLS